MAVIVLAGVQPTASGGRVVFRNSSGIPYVIFGTGAIYKGNSATPTSFSLAASAKTSASLAVACNLSGTTLGVLYRFASGMTDEWRYDTFSMSTDSYAGSDETVAAVTAVPSFPYITADSNGVPHVCYNDQQTNMGSNYNTVVYKNRVGGSWNTAVEVEGATAQVACNFNSLCIDPTNNAPFLAYIKSGGTLRKATSTTNNPSSFTLTDLDASAGSGQTSIFKDSGGDLYVVYCQASNAVRLWDDTSSTSQNPSITANANTHLSGAAVGTDVYVITADNTANARTVYNKFDGTSWGGVTALHTPSSFDDISVRAKWQNEFNYGSDGTNYPDSSGSIPELDYVYYQNDTTAGTYFDSISISSTVNLSGTITCAASIGSADLTLDLPLAGTITSALSTGSANLQIVKALSGTISSAATIGSADLSVTRSLTGTITSAATIGSADLRLTKFLAGTISSALSVGGANLTVQAGVVDLAGTITSTTSIGSADLRLTKTLAGTITSAASIGSADLGLALGMSGTISSVTSTGSASLTLDLPLAGTISSAVTIGSANLSTGKLLSGTISSALSTGSANLLLDIPLSGTVTSTTSIGSADLRLTKALAGTIASALTVGSADLTTAKALSGTITSTLSTGSADLGITKVLSGTIASAVTVGGADLTASWALSGTSSAVTSIGSADLAITRNLTGTITSALTVGGANLSVGATTQALAGTIYITVSTSAVLSWLDVGYSSRAGSSMRVGGSGLGQFGVNVWKQPPRIGTARRATGNRANTSLRVK